MGGKSLFQRIFAAAVLLGLAFPSGLAGQAVAAGAAGDAGAAAAQASCAWSYVPYAPTSASALLGAETLLFDEPNGLSPNWLASGLPFLGKSSNPARRGLLDFNADQQADVFGLLPRPDGFWQWAFSAGGSSAWQTMAYDSASLSQLRFGDLDGDGTTDVLARGPYDAGTQTFPFLVSLGGVGSYTQFHSAAGGSAYGLGDFDGDGKADLFYTTYDSGLAVYRWHYVKWAASPGPQPVIDLAYDVTQADLLRLGDFDGDGKTDVAAPVLQPDGSEQWMMSKSGSGSYTPLARIDLPVDQVLVGDFDGDLREDFLAPRTLADGSLQISYWPGGLGPEVVMGGPGGRLAGPATLSVIDANHDGTDDLLVQRCGSQAPLQSASPQVLGSLEKSIYRPLAADLNGDGLTDVAFVSICQLNGSRCAGANMILAAAIANGTGGFTFHPPAVLSSADFRYFRPFSGDFDGDGREEIGFVDASTSLTIYAARYQDNGMFTLGGAQVFTSDNFNPYNPLKGDFNHDGRTDLALTTVCSFTVTSSCSVGSTNSNYLVLAGAGGVFSLGSKQTLGAGGWGDYYASTGDFNGDGSDDLVYYSTCQGGISCSTSDGMYLYTGLSNGQGGLSLVGPGNYGASGWKLFRDPLVGDVNGDGLDDLVWMTFSSATVPPQERVLRASGGGQFTLLPFQNLPQLAGFSFSAMMADFNADGRADLGWFGEPYSGRKGAVDYYLGLADVSGLPALGPRGTLHGINSRLVSQFAPARLQPHGLQPLGLQPLRPGLLAISASQLYASQVPYAVVMPAWMASPGQKVYLPVVLK